MGDTKKGRDKQAHDAENRQRKWELEQERDRGDEALPGDEQGDSDDAEEYSDSLRECHRRGCDELAAFVVLERYQEETGQGAVEAEAVLCREHTAEESPTNLEGVYANYVFRVTPIPETSTTDTE
ncbi:hypothetical protein [Natrinema salaciae]|uniref:Uncharacterized protein n=1 Tax=Natrinema salaciae TaxID=1186196 RepID=A0A1H9P9S8_9EURY|nr:hypothetical protein [Natrinema salaciae]SER44373.1 hypothetical protein SAMN04489841_3895 [Natrinema salaciae]